MFGLLKLINYIIRYEIIIMVLNCIDVTENGYFVLYTNAH